MTLWAYPFPLESGDVAEFHLPPDLTRSDAERLKKMIDSLVIEAETEEHPVDCLRKSDPGVEVNDSAGATS